MVGHVVLLREFCNPRVAVSSGMGGFEDSECFFTHLLNWKSLTAKYLARHFLPSHVAVQSEGVTNASLLPGAEDPADGVTEQECDTAPPLPLMRDGSFVPGDFRTFEWGGNA